MFGMRGVKLTGKMGVYRRYNARKELLSCIHILTSQAASGVHFDSGVNSSKPAFSLANSIPFSPDVILCG